MANLTTSVLLEKPDNWEDWDTQFKERVTTLCLEPQIFKDERFLTKPTAPILADYLPAVTAVPAVQTRSQSSASQSSSTVTPSDSEGVGFMSLSADGREALKFDRLVYQDNRKMYEDEVKRVQALKDWVNSTVTNAYKKTSCQYNEDIRTWYENLKEAVGQNDYQSQERLRRRYRQAVKPLKRTPRDFEAWITNWEQIITEGKNKKLGFAMQASDWYSDFTNAVIKVLPDWVRIFEVTQANKIENGTLSFRELANDARREVKRFSEEKAGVTRGSFGPTFDGKSAVGEDAPSKGNILGRVHTQEGEKKKRLKRRTSDTSPGHVHTCRGCGLRGHHHLQCYYLFPGKAPKEFQFREIMQKLVKLQLQEDPRLAEEIKQAQKRGKKKEKQSDSGVAASKQEKSQDSPETTSDSST